MEDKDRIIEELTKERDYYKQEVNSFWAELTRRREHNLELAQHIAAHDPKAIANIILNMYLGKMPSDSVSFCEIFELKKNMPCEDGERCTDCIDRFLQQYYGKRVYDKMVQEMSSEKNV